MNIFKKITRAVTTPLCICQKCPSYPGNKDPRVYCEYGKSNYPIEKRGCICSDCPIWKINRFQNHYYCETGKDPKSKI
jgi:hypothetical protein